MTGPRELVGRYLAVPVDGQVTRIFYESAGEGIPMLMLHTAGADSRQWHHVMTDATLEGFQTIAFDLPGHGRSLPLDGWWTRPYRLTRAGYREAVMVVVDALGLDRPVIIGSSMGGAMVLDLVHTQPQRFRAGIGLGAPLKARGRRHPYLHHPACDSGEVAACYTMALNAPDSPEVFTRENWWIYSQGGPGVYDGDLHFYTDDWDGNDHAVPLPGGRCPLHLMSGEYDYSCSPEMARQAATALQADSLTLMQGIGHFPMIENPPLFMRHLRVVLRKIRAAETAVAPHD